MKRFKFMLLLGCLLLQACGSPTMDETPNTRAVSVVQPSIGPSHGSPTPSLPEIPELTEIPVPTTSLVPTPSISVLPQRINNQNGSSYPNPCTYPLAGLATTTLTQPVARSYTFSEPQVVVQGSYAAIDGWTDNQEIIVSYQGIEGIFVTLFDPVTHLSTTLPLEKLPRTPVIVYERAPFVLAQSQTPFMHQLRNQHYIPEPLDIASYAQIRPQSAEMSYLDHSGSLILYDLTTSQPRAIGPFNLKNPYNKHSSLFAYSDRKLHWNTSGSQVLVYDDNGLFLINVAEESICTIEVGAQDPNYVWPMYVAWSPDERYLAIRATNAPMAGNIFGHIVVIDLLTGDMINYADLDIVSMAWIPGTADLIVRSRFRQLEPGSNQGLFLLPYPYMTSERILDNHYLADTRHSYDSLLISQSADALYFACGLDTNAGLCQSEIGE